MKKYLSATAALMIVFLVCFVFLSRRTAETNASPADFCAEHQIAESQCPFCNKSLIEQKGMCREHGVPEALCYQCNPALIPAFKAVGDWCGGHNRPESQCRICNPEEADFPDEKSVSASSPEPLIRLVPAEEVIRSKRIPSVECETEKLRVQLASAETAKDAGFEYVGLQQVSVTEEIECNAETGYNRTRYASISSRAPGIVHDVRANLGQQVEAKEVLAVVDCSDVAKAKADYLEAEASLDAAEKDYKREQRLFEQNVAIEQELLEAEKEFSQSKTALASARQTLKNYGLSEAQIEKVSKEQDVSSLLRLKSPFAGRVVERQAVTGELVDKAKPLFVIADTSSFWAMLDVPEADLKLVRLDQPVVLSLDGLPGENFGGRIIWVSSQIDPQARMLKAHAEIDNSGGLLRANMFGKAKVIVHDKQPVIPVPKEAVQWDGCCNIVFVKRSEVLYEPRKVRLGYETETFYVAESGLDVEETVVTTGSFLLKTEIMKGSIGAGCCEVEPGK